MTRIRKNWRWGLIFAAVLLFSIAALSFAHGREAAAHHTVAFMPDRIGGVGDSWMWPGQAYALSVFCALGGAWLVIRIVREHLR